MRKLWQKVASLLLILMLSAGMIVLSGCKEGTATEEPNQAAQKSKQTTEASKQTTQGAMQTAQEPNQTAQEPNQ